MEKLNNCNVLVVWRGMELSVDVNSNSNVKEFGQKLQELTHVKPDTMRFFVPQTNNKGSRMLSPFSDAHSMLSLQEGAILQGKPIRMMGVLKDEIDDVSQNSKNDLRIVGFDEEEKRLKQRATYRPQSSLKLPQGSYIFCEFRTLQIPGIQLTPPPSEALKRMHMLACDRGIIAIMNKHRWRVGIMTEMAPEGYVGISPECILGFNKNHGEEISLRLRTDDLKGFRKYESIKKTLLHELAHMVYSEHDSKFFALNKQLNEEAANLDWTKSTSHTLSGRIYTDNYEEDAYINASRESIGQKLGGAMNSFASVRASSVAAAYNRLVNVSAKEPLLDDNKFVGNQVSFDSEPDPDDMVTSFGNASILEMVKNTKASSSKSYTAVHDEPDHDDSLNNENVLEPDPDDAPTISVLTNESKTVPVDIAATENEHNPDNNLSVDAVKTIMRHDTGIVSSKLDTQQQRNLELGPDELTSSRIILDVQMEELNLTKLHGEPDPDESTKDMLSEAQERFQQSSETSPVADDSMKVDDAYGFDSQEVQRIEEPAAIFCSRLQKVIDILKSEAAPSQAATALQTLFKIIRNVIEHPGEIKFRRLRKANPQFQRNVANYKAAMEILALVGFCEDVISDEIGMVETFLVLKRNDPGLLWLAKSSLELSIA
ncbi:uncharacterized protein LOC121993186 [Zingiber officinale]|uniref:WLM domain-containing protein n=1 Tax=Zingiber officinale TaxID=94328 RepID=A0A8J5FYM6_ZINOF|nr:uncharacterized protein LOC121993186 [Zingiber officinale]XP_042403811.1 uncharacterized protein LOC121993186 [Zingiber officinale]KAG6496641.1 hypothetical protein ZIOFF_044511 [Zingiber officinale]